MTSLANTLSWPHPEAGLSEVLAAWDGAAMISGATLGSRTLLPVPFRFQQFWSWISALM